MSINISDVFLGLRTQQLPALITILTKAAEYADQSGIEQAELLEARLTEDMHPLLFQIQASLELISRGGDRLAGNEPGGITLEEQSLLELVPRVEEILSQLEQLDSNTLDGSATQIMEVPIGPETTLKLSGGDYVLKFLLPNFYFHLTTAYGILRMKGVPLGKRDFLGPINL